MTGKVVFGYQHFDRDLGSYVRPGHEAAFLSGESFARKDIVIGAYSYRIAGRKGDIVNWLVAHGLQQLRVDLRNPVFAGHRLTLVLHEPAKKMHEIVGEAVGRIAGHFMPHGVVGSLWEARERAGTAFAFAVAGRDALAERGAAAHGGAGGAAGGAAIPGPMAMPYATPPRILDINLGISRSEERAALRVWNTGEPIIDFSRLAGWVGGS